ncbi:unnamed protein product [Hymenolepis diminuta]|uniref:BESS domain-containing protein n=1 Tax=Hymenolepis diminuta TaxID=6216 RepID=A0A0R3SXU8_HYMDI|nr:unnamed protein product [Hymenolepis diminuta]VUZ40954.1 unnamed protein product [Hymenolepis diminuta]
MIEVERKHAELRKFATHSATAKTWFIEDYETVPKSDQTHHSFEQCLPNSKSHLAEIVDSEKIHDSAGDSKTIEQSKSCSNAELHKESQISLVECSDGSDAENGKNDAATNLSNIRSRQVYEDLKATNSSSQENLNIPSDSNSSIDKNGTLSTEENASTDTAEEIETLYPFTDSNEFIEYEDHRKSIPADMYKMCWVELSTVESAVNTMIDPESKCNTEKIIDSNKSQYAIAVDKSEGDSNIKNESTPKNEHFDEAKHEVKDKAAGSHQPKYSKCFLRLVRVLQPDLYEYIEDSPEVQQIIRTNKKLLLMTLKPSQKARSASQVAKTTGNQRQSHISAYNHPP